MARGNYPSDKQDQFMLRLPEGMRDRIKAYAERHGRSMNAEIVRVLEREFPPPVPMEQRLYDLLALVDVLKTVPSDEGVNTLVEQVHQTLRDISSGKIELADQDARHRVRMGLQEWERFQQDNEAERVLPLLDNEELEALYHGDDTFKK